MAELNVDMEKFKQEQAKRDEAKGTRLDRYEVKAGVNELRLLPRSMKILTKERDHNFGFNRYVHYQLFPDTVGYKVLTCSKNSNQVCPVCVFLESLKTREDKQKYSRIRAQERWFYNVLDFREGSGKFKVLESGRQVYDAFVRHWVDPDWGPKKMVSLEDGCLAKLLYTPREKSSTGWGHYDVTMSPRTLNLVGTLPVGWEEILDSLEERIPQARSTEDMQHLFDLFMAGKTPVMEHEKAKQSVDEDRAQQLASYGTRLAPEVVLPKVKVEGVNPVYPQKESVVQQGLQAGLLPKPATVEEVKLLTVPPRCFGEDFQVRNIICMACPFQGPCKVKFVQSLTLANG